MKRLGAFLFTALMVALMLTVGSCSSRGGARIPADGDQVPVIQEAGSSLLQRGSEGQDATAFLVGEFVRQDGVVIRFNGGGTVTLTEADGDLTVGNYSMTEYASGRTCVDIQTGVEPMHYDFTLLSGGGEFTLTDEAGNISTFTPVQY